ncbi:MAG TPA: DUF2309 family protein, partial [Polyangiaceae bacterium]|nr:DUF2309 family protein [Polyangiaceae bacterium]
AVRFALGHPGEDTDGTTLRARLGELRSEHVDPHEEFSRVGPLFHVALTLGLRPADVRGASRAELRALRKLVGQKHEWWLRWLWHLAYERRYRVEVLDALVLHGRANAPSNPEPHTQVLTCIDDREESLRRHLEEIDAGYETYGYAGHYGVAVRFRAVGDPGSRALCPASVEPTHALVEVATTEAAEDRFELSEMLRDRMLGDGGGRVGLVGGAVRALTGSVALLPMAWRLLFPEESARAQRRAVRRPPTRLSLVHDASSPKLFGLPVGFTDDEMADIVSRALTEMGLVSGFAPLVVVLGHGSTSVNNPHAAGYNCGACSGGKGGPNARAFAAMCNRETVRARLRDRGIEIPAGTWFVGGLHDTASDEIELYDLDLAPERLSEEIARLRRDLDVAAARDAHERCRRFASAPLHLDEDAALRHAMGRTQDLAQARPEYNHVTNASCIVGRRQISRGLFLDRRAFLVSYDPQTDSDGSRLGQILASVGPVGAGINLEYFFSFMDIEKYGAGTKLPHNVVGLIGVMNGSSSDLRTGLVEQMIEIHEPMRLLLIIEGRPDAIERAVEQHPGVKKLVDHRWILAASYDPVEGTAHFLEPTGWVEHELETDQLAVVASSKQWYDGQRGCLPPARIAPHAAEPHAAEEVHP